MKRFLLIPLLAMGLAGPCRAQPSGACPELRVAGAEHWVPFSYQDSVSPQPRGLAFDMVRWLAERMNLPVVELSGIPWVRVEDQAGRGAFDLIAGLYGSEHQSARFVLTLPVATDEVRIFVLRGQEFEFDKATDLLGRRGAMLLNIRWSDAFQQVKPALTLDQTTTHESALKMLMLQRVAYVVMPQMTARALLRELDPQGQVVALPHPLAVNHVHLGFSRQSPCRARLAEMNHWIQVAHSTGVFDEMVRARLDRHP